MPSSESTAGQSVRLYGMPPVSAAGLVRLSLLVSFAVWSFASLLIGLMLLFRWPGRFGPNDGSGVGWWGSWVLPLGGALLFCFGEYLLVMLLRELFPRVAPAMSRAAGWAPWVAMAILAPLGVIMWSTA